MNKHRKLPPTLYKKHKIKIWVGVAALVFFFVGKSVEQNLQEAQLHAANQALLTLQSDADNTKALDILKENNPALFELYTFAKAAQNQDAKTLEGLSKSSNSIIADISTYSAATLNKQASSSALYQDMATLNEAYLAIKAGDKKVAQAKLEDIDERSPLASVSQLLKHSTIKE